MMFEILPNPSLETILTVVRAGLLVGAFWVFALAFIRWRRADERQAQHLHAHIERTFAEVRSLHETIAVMSARLDALSERAESDSRLAPVSVGSSQRGYDLAARLAKNGTAVDELVTSCGITRHEAELLTRLHGAKTREAAPAAVRPARAAPAAQSRDTPTKPLPGARAQALPAPATSTAPPQAAMRKRGSLLSVVS